MTDRNLLPVRPGPRTDRPPTSGMVLIVAAVALVELIDLVCTGFWPALLALCWPLTVLLRWTRQGVAAPDADAAWCCRRRDARNHLARQAGAVATHYRQNGLMPPLQIDRSEIKS